MSDFIPSKFANIEFSAKAVNNIGDNIQLIAIDDIYKKMGISNQNIIYINKNDLPTYNGEPVILPISMAIVDYTEKGWANRFSDKIYPVFLGITMAKDFLCPEEVEFFKKYEPIGCRDERTYDTLKKYNINAYLSGCITMAFDVRNKNDHQNKIYIVDVSDEVINNLPESIKKNAIFTSHLIKGKIDAKAKTKEQYEMYKNNAKLVITSLLHCTAPCCAALIPTVCVKSLISYRFSWIDKLVNIYSPENLQQIDWQNPTSIISEEEIINAKKLVLDLAIKRIKNPKENFPIIKTLHEFYMNRSRHQYEIDCFKPYKDFIDSRLTNFNAPYKYAVYGLTQMSEMVVEYMKKNYPNAILTHVYDKYRKMKFYHLTSEAADNSFLDELDYLFVTTNGAEDEIRNMIEQNFSDNKTEKLDKICFLKLYK